MRIPSVVAGGMESAEYSIDRESGGRASDQHHDMDVEPTEGIVSDASVVTGSNDMDQVVNQSSVDTDDTGEETGVDTDDEIEAETGLSRKQTRDWVPERTAMTLEEAEGRTPATGPWAGGFTPRLLQALVRRRRHRHRRVPLRAPGAGEARPRSGGHESSGEDQSNVFTVVHDNLAEGVWVMGVFKGVNDKAVEGEIAPQQRIARENSSSDLVRGTNT